MSVTAAATGGAQCVQVDNFVTFPAQSLKLKDRYKCINLLLFITGPASHRPASRWSLGVRCLRESGVWADPGFVTRGHVTVA